MSDTKSIFELASKLGVTEDEVAEIIEKLTNTGISGAKAGRMLRATIKKLSHRRETE